MAQPDDAVSRSVARKDYLREAKRRERLRKKTAATDAGDRFTVISTTQFLTLLDALGGKKENPKESADINLLA
jgi:hypothetical protein